MTANLQTRRLTVRDAAKIMNVSERMVYMARELLAVDRPDLHQAVERGDLTLLGALKLAKPEKYGPKQRDGLKALRRAWSGVTDAERDSFLAEIGRST